MKKLTYEYVKEQIEKKGYKLLSGVYENAHTKLEVQCPKNHIYKVMWNNFQQEKRCPICASETRANKRLHTYDYVKKFIESKRYKLLSKEYKSAHAKLKLQCPERHGFEMVWSSFQQGKRCSICYNNKKWYTYDYVKEQIERKGYKLLSKDYKGTRAKLKLQCIENHIFETTWSHILRNQGCPICSINKKRHTYDYVNRQVKKRGYRLLNRKYKNAHTKLELQCPKKHKFRMTWNDFRQGHGCPICNANCFSSEAEREIANMIEVQGIKIKRNDRTQVINLLTSNRLELDIWMPELNKAIEFNGTYWHSFVDKIIKDKIKLQECTRKGIELLVIKEQDWIDNKTNCINKIKTFVKNK